MLLGYGKGQRRFQRAGLADNEPSLSVDSLFTKDGCITKKSLLGVSAAHLNITLNTAAETGVPA